MRASERKQPGAVRDELFSKGYNEIFADFLAYAPLVHWVKTTNVDKYNEMMKVLIKMLLKLAIVYSSMTYPASCC